MTFVSTLLSIGDFSRMTFLSVKALRHYHDVGLLPPAEIDAASGYRRYHPSQVANAQVIRRLRDLGMSVDEVKTVIRAPDIESRNAAIAAHLRRMESHLEQTRMAVTSLRNLLAQNPTLPVVTYQTMSLPSGLAVREEVTGKEVTTWRDTAFTELRRLLTVVGLERQGPDSALYSKELLEEEYGEVTAFIPVDREVSISDGRAEPLVLPETEYATALHEGSFDDLDQTFAALGMVVAERAIGLDKPILERYLVSAFNTPDETQHRTEICWPIFQTHLGGTR